MKDNKKLQKLVKNIIKDFIIYGIVSTVLTIISALTRNHFIPVTVNSSYIESIASGGTGIAAATAVASYTNIASYINIIAVILIFGIFITKTINRIRKFIEDENNSNEKDS